MKLSAGLVALSLAASACGHSHAGAHERRVIVLGVDGMDPKFVARHWSALPNVRRLRDQGGFMPLGTTTPPQSPVAWSAFITGLDPEQDGIFDFVERDPATMRPLSSMAETLPPAHELRIGPWLLPLSKARVQSLRRGRAFWEMLDDHDIPVTVIRIPVNYPPSHAGDELAGMGTPDLEGTFGTFTYYTDDPTETAGPVSGGRIVAVAANNGRVTLPIGGPPNTLRVDRRATGFDLTCDVDADASAMRCRDAESEFILKQGEWSPWIRVRFTLIPGVASAAGMFRLYARELRPNIRIYRSPLNIDPRDPALPVSTPPRFSRELAGRVGEFYTQGIPEDTSALRQGALTLDQYLQQSRLVSAEERRILRDSLAHFHDGFLFFYFSEIDQNSHVLWGRHEDELLETYQLVDDAIGDVLAGARGATIVVMSDHGFAAFDRAVNLNTWLEREGFLSVANGAIDWPQTRAYAMGLNAVYVNLAGREKDGIVHPGAERDALVQQLARRLEAFRDPETGTRVVTNVHVVRGGGRLAPDLIVGYAPDYRASWETALGATPPEMIQPNTDAWIADHCIDAAAVPGVLFMNKPLHAQAPTLKDVTVTILKEFGVQPDAAMRGRAVD